MKLDDIVEEYAKMSDEDLNELVALLRRNRQTVTQSKIKEVRKATKKKSGKALLASLSDTDKEEFLAYVEKLKEKQ